MASDPKRLVIQFLVRGALVMPSGYDETNFHLGQGVDHRERWLDVCVVGDDDRMVNLAQNGILECMQSQTDITFLLLNLPNAYFLTVSRPFS